MVKQRKQKSRREFLEDGLRAVLAGGFVSIGLFLGWRREAAAETETSCLINLPCRNCSIVSRCQYPLALEERKRSSNSDGAEG